MQKHLEIWSAARFSVTVRHTSSKPTASNTCGQNLYTVLSVSVKQIHNPPLPVCWCKMVAMLQRGGKHFLTSGFPWVGIRRGASHI